MILVSVEEPRLPAGVHLRGDRRRRSRPALRINEVAQIAATTPMLGKKKLARQDPAVTAWRINAYTSQVSKYNPVRARIRRRISVSIAHRRVSYPSTEDGCSDTAKICSGSSDAVGGDYDCADADGGEDHAPDVSDDVG